METSNGGEGEPTDDWAIEAITTLVSRGIMDSDIRIDPDGSINFSSKQLLKRQEASTLLYLAFDYYGLPIRNEQKP